MDLYTRCGNCNTTFRVTTGQLQASSGKVRCGNCQHIFDAFATLTAQEPQADSDGADSNAAQGEDNQRVEVPGATAPSTEPPAQVDQDDSSPSLLSDPAAALYDWEFRIPEAPRRSALWTVLVVFLSVGLTGQVIYGFHADLAGVVPQSQGLYERTCEWLGCKIGLPKLTNSLHIEVSDLKTIDPEHPNEIQLLISVRNRAPIELAFPAFELTLTNSLEQAIARRVFLPSEYRHPDTRSSGIKAGEEFPIQLLLDTGLLRASGYRLYLFYP